MIKKLKKRFIIIAMIAVSAVLLLLCVTVNAVNFVSVNSQLTDTLEKISDNRGRMPTAEPEPIPEEKDGQPSPPNEDKPVNRGDKEAPFMTRYFVLEYDGNGTLTKADLQNIAAVTDFLRSKSSNPRSVMSLIRTKDGAPHTRYGDEYWRVYDYVDGTICLQQPETDEDFYQAAVGFGTFAQLLSDFPAEKLHETIPNFHNTPDRCRLFREAIERDAVGRAASVQPEIDFALAREAEMSMLQNLLSAGEIPLRVAHNDTKLNNVLLDAKTRKALCVVDLDTVMPGSSLFDFGDAIRYGASTAAEDERDLSKVEMSLERFRVFTRGYVRACPNLTARELELLPLGAKTITLECGMRFLTDHIDGDLYFAVHREGQNLDRARAQFKLAADMEKKWDDMRRIVAEETKA